MPYRISTYLSLDLKALGDNYDFFSSKLKSGVQIMAVIKAAAYGHDAVPFAQYLEKKGASYFAVATVLEGIELRKKGIITPILILSPQATDLKFCLDYNLEPTMYSLSIFNHLIGILQNESTNDFPVHININTGMNRLGFKKEEVSVLLDLLQNNKQLKVKGVFSHFSSSDDISEDCFTKTQIEDFQIISDRIQAVFPYKIIRHLANSSGILNYPESHFDMVRVGIGLYGCANDEKHLESLQNVGILHTKILQINTLPKGESVSYNRKMITDKTTRIATLSIGYADGIPRSWGNKIGFVRIHNQKAFVVGNVTMDMLMVDVSDIACEEGDEALIMSTTQDVYDLAKRTNTISYELFTAVSDRVPRVFHK